jgi:outer membrane protein assembly factor BamE (lipoprotein component of BamABCDE complex)
MKINFILFSIVLIFLGACAQTGSVGKDFNTDNVSKIFDGKTTKQQVLSLLGTPNSSNVNPDGTELWVYQHIKFTKRWGEYTNMNPYTMNDRQLNSVQVMINKKGIVSNCYSVTEHVQQGITHSSRIRCQDYKGSSSSTAPSVTQAQVLEVQQLLNKNGFSAGAPDGIMGSKTQNAIIQFQQTQGLPVDGEVSENLLNTLRNVSR